MSLTYIIKNALISTASNISSGRSLTFCSNNITALPVLYYDEIRILESWYNSAPEKSFRRNITSKNAP